MRQQTIFRKDFSLVVIGQIISLFGNQILRFALPLYLLNQTGSSALFGTILALSFVPMILLYPIGGIIADRINKRNIMVILDFMTAILIFLFYLMVGKMDIVPLMAITLIILCGIQGAYQPAVQASIPVLVETKQIMKGNSIVNLISSLAGMVGPILGGILFSLVGLTPILYVSIGCFFAAAVMEIFIHIPFEKKKRTGNIFVIGFNDLKDSFHFMLKEKPALWKMSLIYASVNLFLTPLILIGLPVIITQHLGFDADTANRFYGYALGGVAAGAISGGLLAGMLSKNLKLKTSPVLLIGCALSVLMGGIALQILNRPTGIYIILVIGSSLLTALSTLFQIQVITYLQIVTPKDLIGKVISCVICICVCTNPIGQFIYGIIFEKLESGLYLPFYAAALIMVGIIVLTRRIFYDLDRN
jgi:Sugar phosphate permease